MIRVLVDTDIGSEIDDALALAYLAGSPMCRLAGVTTVTRATALRARLASAILLAAGRPDIPICPGHDRTIKSVPFQYPVTQAGALASLDHRTTFPRVDAVAFLRRSILEYDGEIVLLALGPLTHVAELFEADPHIPNRLRRLVTMSGNFSGPHPDDAKPVLEWNVRQDPEAADVVFRTRVPGGHYVIGLETTRGLSLPPSVFQRRWRPHVEAVQRLHQAQNRPGRPVTLYDLVAAILALKPDAAKTERGNVTVGLPGRSEIGITAWQPDESGGRHLLYSSISPCMILREFLLGFREQKNACASES